MDTSRDLLLVLVAVLLLFSIAFVLPFLEYFLLAVLLAYSLYPVQKHLRQRTDERLSAALVVAATAVAVIVPLFVLVQATRSEAAALLTALSEGEITLGGVETEIARATGVEINLSEVLRSAIGQLGSNGVDSVVGIFGLVTHALIGLGLTLFLLYYFLKDGDSFSRWLRATLPLDDDVQDDLWGEVDSIARAVLLGHVFIAVVQGVLAGIGLVVAGVPNALLWTVVMVVLSLLPIVGSFLVWGPAAVYLFVVGRPVAAALLALYGTVIVGVSDDYLRPIVVDRYAHVNPSVIILGVVGGIYVMGFMGIFFGPIIIGALRATLDVFREQYGDEMAA
jgi:predicted PurR-regulated permease PerM